MATFTYAVRDKKGDIIHGTAELRTKEEVIRSLHAKDLVVISVEEKKAPLPVAKKFRRRLHKKARTGDLIVFARQLAALLEAGVPLLKAIDVLTKQVESRVLLEALKKMGQDLKAGASLKEAAAKHPKVFSQMWVDLIETGEAIGQLAFVLHKLADYFEEMWMMRKKVVSALIYPAVLVCVAIFAIFIFMYKVIPVFAEIYKGFANLPALTAAVIAFSDMLAKNIFKFVALAAALGFIFSKVAKTEKGRYYLDALKLRIPVAGDLLLSIAVERFTTSLSMLLKGGVSIVHALEVAIKATANTAMEAAFEKVRLNVLQGKTISAPMAEAGIFPPLVTQMMSVGEESGKLAQLLDEVSKFYASDISTKVTRIVSLVEPAILVLMGGAIGILVVAMYLPIFSMAQAAGGGF